MSRIRTYRFRQLFYTRNKHVISEKIWKMSTVAVVCDTFVRDLLTVLVDGRDYMASIREEIWQESSY